MYCHNCGEENIEGAKFCSKCGKPLNTDTGEKVINKKTTGKNRKIVLITFVGIVLCGIVFAMWNSRKSVRLERIEDEVKITQETKAEEKVLPFFTSQQGEFSDGDTPNGYILPESDSRVYTREELMGLTDEELRIARNEIFARHGRKFTSEDMNLYFSGQVWYTPIYEAAEFDALGDSVLNEVERMNRDQIVELENNMGHSAQKQIVSEIEDDDISGEYYYYRAYFDEEITKEMTPQTTKDWMTVTWNDGALLVRFDNEWETEEREYVKDGDNHYVYRTYLDDSGCVYEFPLEFYGNGTVGVFSYDGLEWSMYKKQ